jgi:hypothetical protein
MTEKCKPVKDENVLIVDVRGNPAKHTRANTHRYTYESSEVFPDGQGKDQYNAILIRIVWECPTCGRVVTQIMRASAPRKCGEFIEIEDSDTT